MNRMYAEKQVVEFAVSGYSEGKFEGRGLDYAGYLPRNNSSIELRGN